MQNGNNGNKPVKILNGALDEHDGNIVLRGVIAPESFVDLRVDDYQREVAPLTSQTSILSALQSGEKLPDIELGMRGQKYRLDKDGNIWLQDPTYIIDGLQRTSTAIHFLNGNAGAPVRIGALIHFDTTKEWERDRFRILNTLRAKVSPNILLRNRRETSRAVLSLSGLCENDKTFVLHRRVSWGQRMTRGELITALTMAKIAGILHSHKAAGRYVNVDQLVPALDKAGDVIGITNVRENVKAFFDLIDECFGIRRVQYRESAVHMRSQFLFVFARLLSDHTDFWRQPDEKKLAIDARLKRKIAQFPIHDPTVMNLAGSSGKSRDVLYMLLRDHINRGKTTKRLSSRKGDSIDFDDEDVEEEALKPEA
ncbi:MAG: hypothetical protein KA104_03435 [Candidatus Pacebacteria bacterium]|nr:hypothetical protein [Candidatus Paceibacterota bacterium]